MLLKCNRCYHHWKTRKEVKPKVCPSCKSKRWEDPLSPEEEKTLIQDMCRMIIQQGEHLGYVDLSPRLLLVLVVSLVDADKVFREGGFSLKAAMRAGEILDPLNNLVEQEIFPEGLLYTLIRLRESYFRDYLALEKGEGVENGE